MARTGAQIRQLTLDQTGLRFITGTADVGGSTTTLKDSILQVYNNDKLIGLHLLLTAGADTLTDTIITDSVQSTGIVTLRTTLSADPDGDTYEISPFSHRQTNTAISDAALELYAEGFLTRPFVGYLVAGSPLYNADWGYWDAAATVHGWTVTNSTLARVTTSPTFTSTSSVQLTSTAGSFTIDSEYRAFMHDLAGQTVTLYCPVWSNTGASARLNFLQGATNNYSSYHTGNSSWQILSVEVDLPNVVAGEIRPILLHDNSGATDRFGMPWFEGGTNITELPYSGFLLPDGPTTIEAFHRNVLEDEIASGIGTTTNLNFTSHGRNVTFESYRHFYENSANEYNIIRPLSTANGRVLRLYGHGPLTDIGLAETTTLEVSHTESIMLAVKAAILLLERSMQSAGQIAKQDFATTINRLTDRLDNLKSSAGQSILSAPLPLRW